MAFSALNTLFHLNTLQCSQNHYSMKQALWLFLLFLLPYGNFAQSPTLAPSLEWTAKDRTYLLENLTRSKDELLKETAELTEEQWCFKESPDRWSINQVVEHLAIWELVLMHEISVALQMGPIDNFNPNIPDITFLNQDPDVNPNKTESFTKPFSYTIPLGQNEGMDNVNWWLKMRTESIGLLQGESRNLRRHYINFGQNVHQQFMVIFSHTDRHLKQIMKVKQHPEYPD